MDINKFIEHIRDQYDFLDDDVIIDSDTEFKNLEDWDSLVALSIIAMIDEEYDVSISGDDIRNSSTVQDLMDLVIVRKVTKV